MEDRSIASAVARGDRDAFRAIVEREGPTVFRTCYRILGRHDEAEDAAQESFVIAYRSLSGYRGEGSLGAWVARIAARHSLRRLQRRRSDAPIDDFSEVLPDLAADPLSGAVRAERARAVRAAVVALGEPYREVVALRFFGELSLAEIAAATGRPMGTVKTHLHRGLERLGRSLPRDGAT